MASSDAPKKASSGNGAAAAIGLLALGAGALYLATKGSGGSTGGGAPTATISTTHFVYTI